MEAILIIWLLCGGLAAFVASAKGLNVGLWLILGIAFGFIALLIVAVMPSAKKPQGPPSA